MEPYRIENFKYFNSKFNDIARKNLFQYFSSLLYTPNMVENHIYDYLTITLRHTIILYQ